ncbi:MAG: tRNA-dihydrouridine synthase B [Parcubacteria bacterium C7867-007]|nr:MAG: tRNA-dihydrouridine synthase B [Parcubacteria bacterium C7867-007]
MDSFWSKLPKPFFALAPMADVTDPAYRRLIAEYGAPHVTWTEFVSADGLYHTREKKGMKDGENPLVRDLQYSEAERPIVAQIFGSIPETIEYASELVATLGFDGVDINMGCPDRSIEKQGAGAGMIKTPELVAPIVEAARRGAARGKEGGIPVSLKTRIGYHQETMDTWLPVVLAAKPDALTVHLRTRKEMSKVDAHWELMARAVALRDAHSPNTIILGNGDVNDLNDARTKAEASGADGIMLGRAIFGTPWLFTDRVEVTPAERIEALRTLAQYFSELRPTKSFHLLKKHIKSFITGWDGAAQLRGALMNASTLEELESILAAAKP